MPAHFFPPAGGEFQIHAAIGCTKQFARYSARTVAEETKTSGLGPDAIPISMPMCNVPIVLTPGIVNEAYFIYPKNLSIPKIDSLRIQKSNTSYGQIMWGELWGQQSA